MSQRERAYHVVLPDAIELAPTETDEGTTGHRGWALDELLRADEVLAPRRLAELVDALLRDGPPDTPFDAGV